VTEENHEIPSKNSDSVQTLVWRVIAWDRLLVVL
jgi:hypothetical protein